MYNLWVNNVFFFFYFPDNESIIRCRRRRLRWQVAEGVFKSYVKAAIFWKSIMPVGGRVAGKGVGVYNSGGSSDGIIKCSVHVQKEYLLTL